MLNWIIYEVAGYNLIERKTVYLERTAPVTTDRPTNQPLLVKWEYLN